MMERGGPSHHGGFGHSMWSNPKAAVEGYLASLKVELKITPDQEKAWQTFTGKARTQADTMIARRAEFSAQAQSGDKTLPAPERLAQRTERMKQGLASMETMTAAVKDLYGVLTPEQKTIADQQLARGPMGGFGGGRGHHRRS
jgi:protein CpxP